MQPLIIGEALRALGASGSIVAVVSLGVALWHYRSILSFLQTIGFATKVIGAFVFVLSVAVVLVPGLSVEIAVARVTGWLSGVIEGAMRVAEVVV